MTTDVEKDYMDSEDDSAVATAEPEEAISPADAALLEEMTRLGILYGRKRSKTNPKMKQFIFTTRNGIEVFDLPKTLSAIAKAQEFLKSVIAKGSKILLVGTQPAAKDLIKEMAGRVGMPYVTERWLGGTLTNFKTISKRLNYYLQQRADMAAGRLDKYTKKERTMINKEISRLEILFGGLEKLTELPAALVMVDAVEHDTALREARRINAPVVAIANSDNDPDEINYPIPANSGARSSIKWILEKLESAIAEAQKELAAVPAKPAEK